MDYFNDDFALLGDEAQSQPQLPFATHRYVSSKDLAITHPHHHHHRHHLVGISTPIDKPAVVEGDSVDEHEGYSEAFAQTDVSHHCFLDSATDPFVPQQHLAAEEVDSDEDGGAENNPKNKGALISASPRNLHRQQQMPHHIPPKRKDRDALSDDESPYCHNINAVANKRSKSMPSSRDYQKDREEWSDTTISSLLDAYAEKFV